MLEKLLTIAARHNTSFALQNESVRLEAGYMNQFLSREFGENRSNHLAVLIFRVSR